jgi:hypothetical protein
MKIAIVSHFGHYECIGFLCESLSDHSIVIYSSNDNQGYNAYYRSLFPKQITDVILFGDNLNICIDDFDYVFKLTSNDNCINDPRIISLLHVNPLRDISKRYISLTPYVFGDDVTYMFPTYNNLNNKVCYDNRIIYIGYFLESFLNDGDLINLIRKLNNFTFEFIVWGQDNYDCLKQFHNVNVYNQIPTDIMISMIQSSKFILPRKLPFQNEDRFSGMLSLAVVCDKPIILQKQINNVYQIPTLTFNQNYSELIDTIQSINTEDYDKLVNDIKSFKQREIQSNKDKMNLIISKV